MLTIPEEVKRTLQIEGRIQEIDDWPWVFVGEINPGHDGRVRWRCPCRTAMPLSTADRPQRIAAAPSPVEMEAYPFALADGRRATYFIGQCPDCGKFLWAR